MKDSLGQRNPFRYRGYYYDVETGLYYVSRYYDPEIRRFISADDTEVLSPEYENFAQYNLYAYCFNNPVNLQDEDGTWPKWAAKVLIGTAAITVGVVATAINGGSVLPALIGALKLAGAGAAVGSSVAAVKHVAVKKTFKGIGKAAKAHRIIIPWIFGT